MSALNYTGRIVSGKGSCPVCAKNKSWSYPQGDNPHSPSFVICYGSAPATPGWKYLGDTDLGGGKYIRKGALSSDHLIFDQITPHPTSDQNLAPIEQRDRVYRALFDLCPIERKHARQINLRHFSPAQLDKMKDEKLGSLGGNKGRVGIVKRLCEQSDLGYDDLVGVPGFYVNKYGHWTLSGVPGLLIPSRDHKQRIQGIQIRPDKPFGDAKYIWLSSAKHAERGGTSSGSPIGIIYPEGWDFSQEITRVKTTEGYFKAHGLVAIDDVPVIWFAGTGSPWRVCEFLREIGSPGEIELVFDADWQTNHRVRGAMCKLASALSFYRPNQPTQVSALGWNSKYGKGIDDALLIGKMPYHELLETYDMTIDLDRLQTAQDSNFKHSHLKTDLRELPIIWEPRKKISKEEVWTKTRAALLEMFAASPGTFAFITAGTGGGKTYTCIYNAPKGTIFIPRNYRVLRETHSNLRALGKDARVFYGRQQEPGSLSPEATQEQREEYEAELARFEKAGCFHYEQANEAGGANHNPCLGCPLFEYHHNPLLNPDPEISCRYWSHRDAIEGNLPDYLLMMPQTLLSHPELMEDYKIVILDDIDNLDLLLCNQITLTLDDVTCWIEHPEAASMPEALLHFIHLLDSSLQLENKEGGWTRENLKDAAADALLALRQELAQKRREKLPRMASCEQPFASEEEVGLAYPHKRLQQLLETIALNKPLRFGSAELYWLEPRKKALEMMRERVVICLDATPRLSYWRQVIPALGFQLEVPELPRLFPKLLQLCDRLYSKDQLEELKPTFEALREKMGMETTALFSLEGMFEGQHGYFGRDERGLNRFAGQGFEAMLLLGHFQMSEAQAKNHAWCLRAFAQHMELRPPDARFDEQEEPDKQGRVWRKYTDVLRPYERKSYRSGDPLAEELRRYHNSSSVLQAGSRLRNIVLPIILASGEPLDGLEFEIPVELVTLSELLARYEVDGGEPSTPRTISAGLAACNEERQAEAEARYQENLLWALNWSLEQKRLPSQNELRCLLAEDGKKRASSELAKRVLDGLLLEAAKRDEKALSEGQSWSLFEGPEDVGGEGEEETWPEIGSGEPHTALIKDIKATVQFTPILSCDEPSIGLEREGEEAPRRVTEEGGRGRGAPPPSRERGKGEREADDLMLAFHSLWVRHLLRLPVLRRGKRRGFNGGLAWLWKTKGARVGRGSWGRRWGKRWVRFYERGRAGPASRGELAPLWWSWASLRVSLRARVKSASVGAERGRESGCESRGPPG